jgi:hypothetical protein
MKVPTLTLFSEYVHLPANTSVTVYSAVQHMEHLVDMQPMALQVVADFSANVSGNIEAHIEHAGDGLSLTPNNPNWKQKNAVSEIPPTTFGAVTTVNHTVATGGEVFGAPPSHEFVRVAVKISTTTTSVARLCVYATGQRRVNRVRHIQMPGDEALADSLRDRLPRDVVEHVEAFRKRAQMSQETIGELQRVWDSAETKEDPMRRAEQVSFFLSSRARREVDKFQNALRTLPPHVLPALKRGIAQAAFAELARPEWRFDEE